MIVLLRHASTETTDGNLSQAARRLPQTKDALAKRTQEYQQWVEAFARNRRIPIEWPDAESLKTKKLKKEDYVRPYGHRMERQKRFGVYFIFKASNRARSSAEVPDR